MGRLEGKDLSATNLLVEAAKNKYKQFNSIGAPDLQGYSLGEVSGKRTIILKCNLENETRSQEAVLDIDGFRFGYNNRKTFEEDFNGQKTIIYHMVCLSKDGPMLLSMTDDDVRFTARLFGINIKST